MAKLLFFGRFSDVAENGDFPLPENVTDTEALTQYLSERFTGFADIAGRAGTRIAVNKAIIRSTVPVTDADEIAYMSALSGG